MKFMIFMTTLIGLSVQAAELKPFAAYKGVMESFERKIGEFNTEALYGLNKAQKLSAIPVSGDTITVTPGETIALAFKNKDVKTPLHRGKVVYRLEGSSANFEFKDGSRPTIIEFEKDINVPEARKDMTRVWSAKFNPHMKETDPTTFNSVNQMLLITAQNPYYNPPHQVEDHNALAGKVLMAYVFNHEKDGSPAYKIKIDYKSLTAGKSSQELLDENAAQSRDEKGGRPDRASKGEGSSTDEVRPPTMKERLQEMKLKRKK